MAKETKIKISELIPDDKNFNSGSEYGQSLIQKSFEKFGAGRSILIDRNNKIIAGNKSTENYGALGNEDVIVVESDGKKLIAVKRTDIDLDTPEGREMALADNATAKANIVWAEDVIAETIGVEVAESWGVDFKEQEIPEAQEDDFNGVAPKEPITVLGDLYDIGEHRLLCGDSTCSDTVGKLMNGNKWDSLTTSPPYNQGNGSGDLLTNGKKEVRLYNDKNADNKTKDEYYKFCIDILNNAYIFKNDIHSLCWNVSYNAKSRNDYGKIIFGSDNPFNVHETIIWDKGHSINLPQVGIYSRRCEFVFVMSDYDKYLTSQIYNDCRWNYWNISSNKSQTTGESVEHRAAYPVEFASKMINDFSLIDNLIYEPFTGSGTTMVASHQLKRKCYGMELDPKYCDVIVARMIKLDSTLEIKRNGVKLSKKELQKFTENTNG